MFTNRIIQFVDNFTFFGGGVTLHKQFSVHTC